MRGEAANGANGERAEAAENSATAQMQCTFAQDTD